MRVCILGGGVCGLVAALHLSKSSEVTILERDRELGGCLSSYRLDGAWVERFYHHCFARDSHLLSLLDEVGLSDRLEWLRGTAGSFADGKIYPLNTPLEILRYPYLSPTDKARLALFTMRARKEKLEDLDMVTARAFIVERLGEKIYAQFFRPLLRSKFGDRENEVSAGWLVSRVAIRSNRGLSGERLGYLRGGFHLLVERLAEIAGRQEGCTIEAGTPATRMERKDGGWVVNGTRYDRVLSTIPPQEVTRIGGPDLPPIPYQGAACMALGLDRDVTGGVYWLNMKDPAPYGAVVSHTNFIPPERYGGRILYLASYFQGKMDPGLPGKMFDDFCSRFGVTPESIRWKKMAVEPFAGPVYITGYRNHIPAYEQGGLFLAGMFSLPNYPERSMEGSIVAGTEVARRMEEAITHG